MNSFTDYFNNQFNNQFTDDEIIKNITYFLEEIESLDPSKLDNSDDIEDTKHGILGAIKLSIHTCNIKMLSFLLKQLLETIVIKLSIKDLNDILSSVEDTKNCIEHEKMENLVHDFINNYDNSDANDTKWTGSIKKRRRLSNITLEKTSSTKRLQTPTQKTNKTRRKIGSNIRKRS